MSAAHQFSAITLEQLIEWLARLCSADATCAALQADQQALICNLQTSDAGFALWCDSDRVCSNQLAESLLADDSWRDGSSAAQQLWQLANITLRLRVLENQFAATVEARVRSQIYHLAYGLSHELNNPLANIATRAGVLMHGEAATDRRQLLETMVEHAMRGSEMLGDLMLVARPPRIQFQRVALRPWLVELVQQAAGFAEKRQVAVMCSELPSDLHFTADPVALRELLWCLLRNAIEASPETSQVAIEVRSEEQRLVFAVLDEGQGLSPTDLAHCFDLFYSGREAGRGLGMGLAKAALLAKLHGAQLSIANRSHTGCVAQLCLPLRVE